MRTCKTCGIEKDSSSFYSLKTICKSCHAISCKQWRDKNKERKQKLNSNWYYTTKYGITYDSFLDTCSLQSNKCKICDIDLTFKGKSNKSAVQDHDHNTGYLRGVLCNACNVGLGHFKDNKNILQKAINYLKEYEN